MKIKKRVWIRILALFLVLTMVVGYWASAMISINIASDASDAAIRYLAESTEYVNSDRSDRFADLIQSFKQPETIDDFYLRASMKIGAAEYEDALIYIDKCIEMSSPIDNREIYVDALTKKGCLLTLLGRDDEAITVLEKAISTEATLSDVYLVLAQIYLNRNEVSLLEDILERYLEVKPDDTDMRITYMQTLAAEGKDDAAAMQSYLILGSADITTEQKEDALYIWSINAFKQEDFKTALEKLEEIKDENGKYGDLYYNKGICYMSLGQFQKARDTFSESIEKGLNLQNCYYSRAVTEYTLEGADYEAVYNDLVSARDYTGEDRDEETAQMASEFMDAVFETVN